MKPKAPEASDQTHHVLFRTRLFPFLHYRLLCQVGDAAKCKSLALAREIAPGRARRRYFRDRRKS